MIKLPTNTGTASYTPMSRRLFDAIRASRLVQVKLLVYKNQLNINTRNEKGENSLIEALRIDDDRRRRITFSFLLKCGIDVHNRDGSQRDSLEWAAKLNREKQTLQLLNGPMLEYDYHHKDRDGFSLLHYATINNMEKVVKTILKRLTKYYISVDISDNSGLTPYLYAKKLHYDGIARALVEAGASPHLVDRNENKPNLEEKRAKEFEKIIQLKINGRLPQLRQLAVTQSQSAVHNPVLLSHGISSLLELKREGEICDKYVHSTSIAELESIHTSTANEHTANASHMSSSNSVKDLNEIFEIVSEQMTLSFCRPALQPKPKSVALRKNKSARMSTLAAIMKKPITERTALQQIGRRKSHLRKGSKLDMMPRAQLIPDIKRITVTSDK